MARENEFDDKLVQSLGTMPHIIHDYLKNSNTTFKNMLLKLHINFCSKCSQYFWTVYLLGLIIVIGLVCIYHNELSIAGKVSIIWMLMIGICIYEGIKLYSLIPKLIKHGYKFQNDK